MICIKKCFKTAVLTKKRLTKKLEAMELPIKEFTCLKKLKKYADDSKNKELLKDLKKRTNNREVLK